jgi:hypothetical protein
MPHWIPFDKEILFVASNPTNIEQKGKSDFHSNNNKKRNPLRVDWLHNKNCSAIVNQTQKRVNKIQGTSIKMYSTSHTIVRYKLIELVSQQKCIDFISYHRKKNLKKLWSVHTRRNWYARYCLRRGFKFVQQISCCEIYRAYHSICTCSVKAWSICQRRNGSNTSAVELNWIVRKQKVARRCK